MLLAFNGFDPTRGPLLTSHDDHQEKMLQSTFTESESRRVPTRRVATRGIYLATYKFGNYYQVFLRFDSIITLNALRFKTLSKLYFS